MHSSLLISVKDSGILVFNDDGITHIEKTGSIRFEIETSSICPGVCMALGDSETVLLTDSIGSVFVLQLGDSRLSKIGETSPASTIAVLDDTTVYIGSSSGESCLIELDELVTPKSFAVLETFPNAAPIFDFIYTDGTSYLGSNTIESNGLPGAKISGTVQRGRAIACCGTGAQGSLQVLSNGIGMVEIFEMEDVSGVQGLWAGASDGSSAGSDDLLVVSFVGETRVLQFVEDGCNELDADDCLGLALDEETLVFGNVEFDQLVQITPSRVTLLRSVDRLKLDEWVAPANKRITLGTFNSSQILVAAGGNELLFFEIQEGSLALKGQVQTESQASCIDISSPTDMTMANFAALGTWGDSKVRILQLPSMRVVFEDDSAAAEPQLPRSVKFARLGGTAFLLVGFGDGQLVAFALDAAGERVIVGSKKRLVLGTQSLHLVPFKTENRDCVFAASDMPTVLYAGNNNKLVCSNLNLKNVLSGCQFRLPSNPGAIALATPTSLKIGSLDNIQKLHIQKIPLQETPRRISWWEGGGFFGVLTGIVDPTSGNEQSFLRVFDNQTYECVDSFEFKVDEIPQSICSIPMSASSFTDESPESLFVVGTAILNAVSSQEEPEAGRVIVFAFDKRMRKLQLVCEIATSGCVYGLAQLEIGMVVAAVKSQVQVLQVVYDADLNIYSFVSLCSAYGFVQSIYISVRGRIVTVGDLVNTVTMLEFVPASSMDGTEARLVDVARDYLPAWTTAVHAVNDEGLVVVGEIGSNLYALRRQTEVTLEEEHRRLELVGMFHLGEFVNSIKRGDFLSYQLYVSSDASAVWGGIIGSLASRAGPEHPNEMQANSMLFCTSSGTFGSIVPVKAETFQILSGLQSNMQKHIVPVGGFGHVEWRTFASDKRTHESVGFIDGDFVQQFASMDAAEMEQVFCGAKNAGVKVEADSVERVLEILEELAAVV
ncbi:DNA damage-binding protein 1a [Entophlyctis luteolus]|nr:DNA damage-binding protein 1a [Entophlyctis luteolus]